MRVFYERFIRNLVLYPTELRALARRRILTKNVMKTHCLFFVCVNPNCDGLTFLDFIKHNYRYATADSIGRNEFV